MLLIVSIVACARQGVITGGDKDITPPVLLEADPENYSTNFNKKKFELEFNEYINGTKIAAGIFVSPPLKKKPRVIVKASSFVVSFQDTLRENTSYTFNFGSTIQDLNENNVIKNFEYVVSTGSYIDSLGVKGQILDAFTLLPEKEGFYAALYSNTNDSAPYKYLPDYISTSSDFGIYSINNVKPGIYRLYALKDANSNMKFDPKTDKIAFADTLVHLNPDLFQFIDTAAIHRADTLAKISQKPNASDKNKKKVKAKEVAPPKLQKPKNDTLTIDSIMHLGSLYAIFTDLFLFQEKDNTYRLKDYGRRNRRSISFRMSSPIDTSIFKVKPIYYDSSKTWYQTEYYSKADSVVYWLRDTAMINSDTLRLQVKYLFTDKVNKTVIKTDTLNLRFLQKENKKAKKKQEKMVIQSNISGVLELNDYVSFTTQYPIDSIDKSRIELSRKKDTLWVPEPFVLKIDTNLKRTWIIDFKKAENTDYKILIPQATAKSIYNLDHDTFSLEFKTKRLEDYASISVILSNVSIPMILQLIKGEVVIKQLTTRKDKKLTFAYLNPDEYILKLIYDRNGNGEWDTGNLLKQIQPEKIEFSNEKQNVRANSEYEIEWKVK